MTRGEIVVRGYREIAKLEQHDCDNDGGSRPCSICWRIQQKKLQLATLLKNSRREYGTSRRHTR